VQIQVELRREQSADVFVRMIAREQMELFESRSFAPITLSIQPNHNRQVHDIANNSMHRSLEPARQFRDFCVGLSLFFNVGTPEKVVVTEAP
jgi:hypothetical protein